LLAGRVGIEGDGAYMLLAGLYAAAVAPIGAVVGEWVGASRGLGYLMLHANARMQIDLMFAALVILAAIALALYAAVDRLAGRLAPWQAETFDDLQEKPSS